MRVYQFLRREVFLRNGRYLYEVPIRESESRILDGKAIGKLPNNTIAGGGSRIVGNSNKVARHFQEGIPSEEIDIPD